MVTGLISDVQRIQRAERHRRMLEQCHSTMSGLFMGMCSYMDGVHVSSSELIINTNILATLLSPKVRKDLTYKADNVSRLLLISCCCWAVVSPSCHLGHNAIAEFKPSINRNDICLDIMSFPSPTLIDMKSVQRAIESDWDLLCLCVIPYTSCVIERCAIVCIMWRISAQVITVNTP